MSSCCCQSTSSSLDWLAGHSHKHELSLAKRKMLNLTVLLSYDSSAVSDLDAAKQLLQEIGKVFEQQQQLHAAPQTPERVKSESKMMELGGRMTALYEQLLSRYKTIEDAAPEGTSASIAHLKKLLAAGLVLNMVGALALAYFFISQIQFQNLRNETYRDIISKVPKDVQVLRHFACNMKKRIKLKAA